MNQYLLLRDNKQTGPYTVAELAAKGLKAYDLVWLEGKSAAWRYPSEIAELKPFAPVVEEQPYDRFYKKTQQESHPALEQAQKAAMAEAKQEKAAAFKAVEEPAPVQHISKEETNYTPQEETPAYQEPEPVPQPTVHPKKIYVTLPASPGNGSKNETKKTAASFSQSINKIAEERPVVKTQEVAPIVSINESFADNTIEKDLYTQLQENERSKKIKPRRSMRPVMLTLTAASLLLFGVIIGLYISNMKQQAQNQSLEEMVKRIQDREKNRNNNLPVTEPNQPASEMQQVVDSSGVQKDQPVDSDPKLHISTVARKGNTPPDSKQAVHTAPDASQNNAPIVSNTATQEDAGKEKITYQQAAIESARKNIHQQLLVENSKFKTGMLGGISDLHMTISNNSRFPLEQVEIEIKYFGPEQKLVKTQTLLFNDLAPGEQKTLEAPRTSRGITFDYSITRIQSKVLGLAQHRF
jgi:hypothetical protein